MILINKCRQRLINLEKYWLDLSLVAGVFWTLKNVIKQEIVWCRGRVIYWKGRVVEGVLHDELCSRGYMLTWNRQYCKLETCMVEFGGKLHRVAIKALKMQYFLFSFLWELKYSLSTLKLWVFALKQPFCHAGIQINLPFTFSHHIMPSLVAILCNGVFYMDVMRLFQCNDTRIKWITILWGVHNILWCACGVQFVPIVL